MATAETEKKCLIFNGSKMKVIGLYTTFDHSTLDGCDWLVDKMLINGSGFVLLDHSYGGSSGFDWSRYLLAHQDYHTVITLPPNNNGNNNNNNNSGNISVKK
jgi:hypothetical protein